MIPLSIQTPQTLAIEESHKKRCSDISPEQLLIAIEEEYNLSKLSLWLEMFGITHNYIDTATFTNSEIHKLLSSLISIKRDSGTLYSIEKIGYVIGASSCKAAAPYSILLNGEKKLDETWKLNGGYFITLNGSVGLNGTWILDAGLSRRHYVVNIEVEFNGDLNNFKKRFKNIFTATQPARLTIQDFIIK